MRGLLRAKAAVFFPGGMGTFFCPKNEYLVFEDGPELNFDSLLGVTGLPSMEARVTTGPAQAPAATALVVQKNLKLIGLLFKVRVA